MMKRRSHLPGLMAVLVLLFLVLLHTHVALAQDDTSAPPSNTTDPETPPDSTTVPAGQEVEVNEDNYRQFMELKDARRQRNVLPQDAFDPKSGLQKLDKLPEESQKHLRNQLREIIVQGDQWQPGDEAENYRYVPSQAAEANSSLRKQEAEAWGELVDSYHKREAQIYANSARSQAAKASGNSHSGGTGGSSGSTGDGTGQAASGETDNPQSRAESQKPAEDSQSPANANVSRAGGTTGVSQNAMEFLNRIQNRNNGTGTDASSLSQGRGGQGENGQVGNGPGDSGQAAGQAQEIAQQEGNVPDGAAEKPPHPSNDPVAASESGSSQNAMEFLQASGTQQGTTGESSADASENNSGDGDSADGDSGDGEEQGEEMLADQQNEDITPAADASPVSTSEPVSSEPSRTGASQNALEYLTAEEAMARPAQAGTPEPAVPEGTLTIQELMNAQGVGGPAPSPPPVNIKNDVEDPDGDIPVPDKDG